MCCLVGLLTGGVSLRIRVCLSHLGPLSWGVMVLVLGMLLGIGRAVEVEGVRVAARVKRWYATGSGVMFWGVLVYSTAC